MSRTVKLAIAGGIALVGVLGLVFVLTRVGSSPREYVAQNYTRASSEDGESFVYTSPKQPGVVAEEITERWEPAERLVDPAGYFLRYSDTFIVVTAEDPGSRIYVDDEDRGYARWYPFIGGYWGTFSGRGEGFRGGGPGAGK